MSTGLDLSTFPFTAQGAPEALIRQHLLLGRFELHAASANYARDTERKACCRRGGQEASRLDDRLDRARLVQAREALTLVTGSTDAIEPMSSPSCPTAIVLSYPPKEKGTASPRQTRHLDRTRLRTRFVIPPSLIPTPGRLNC
jgi:hypothetical protein